MADKQRIEYIDLIKGITIVLVMYYHCPVPEDNHAMMMLSYTRIPTYVFLSGLFFSTYDSFKQFVVKKTNRYIIPLVFFVAFALITLPLHYNGLNLNEFKSFVYDIVVNGSIERLNGPMWFLEMLIWLSLFSYAIDTLLKDKTKALKASLCIIISLIVFTLNDIVSQYEYNSFHAILFLYNIKLPAALILLPTFYIPHLFRTQILCYHKPRLLYTGLPITLIVLYLCADSTIIHSICKYNISYPRFFIGQFAGIYSIFVIGYVIKRLPFFSFVGRYSIIVLGTHMLVKQFFIVYLNITDPYILFAILVVTAPICILVIKQYFPHFTAQKDLLKLSPDGKLKISFKD